LRGELTYEQFHASVLAWERSDAADEARVFWPEALDGVGPDPEIDFLEAPRGARPPAGRRDSLRVPVPSGLHAIGSGNAGVTPFMAFCAALAVALGHHSGQARLGLITAAARRGDPAVEQLAGWLSNTIVIPVVLEPRATLRALLGQVRATVTGALDRSGYGRNSLIRELEPAKFGTVRRHAGVFVLAETDHAGPCDWRT
jgi:hypothetical protein